MLILPTTPLYKDTKKDMDTLMICVLTINVLSNSTPVEAGRFSNMYILICLGHLFPFHITESVQSISFAIRP